MNVKVTGLHFPTLNVPNIKKTNKANPKLTFRLWKIILIHAYVHYKKQYKNFWHSIT